MCSFFLPVLAAAAFFSPVDAESLPPVDDSVSVVSEADSDSFSVSSEVDSDSSLSVDSDSSPLSSVIVENVDEIAAAVASHSDAAPFASSPPVSGAALDEFSFFDVGRIRFYVPSNSLEYVKLIDSPPYVLNTSSSSVTLWSTDVSIDYRLQPMGGLQKRVYSSGASYWQDVTISSKPESNISGLLSPEVVSLAFLVAFLIALLLACVVFK